MNLYTHTLDEIAAKWHKMLGEVAGEKMTDAAPKACKDCPHRWSDFQLHDEAIVSRARSWRANRPNLYAEVSA